MAAEDVPLAAIEAISADVVAAVSVKRAVWTHWNLVAEASKQTMDLRFATTEDREAVIGLVVDAAQSRSVVLTPPELALSPARFQREDGTSRFRPRHGEKYSSTAVLDAEARLLGRAERVTAPTVAASVASRAAATGKVQLSAQQRRAVERICHSGRQVDVLVGPAGAGKTTTMRVLRTAWITERGRGSVVGLAPSAAASQALADDLGVACENTAKWLHEYDHGRTDIRRGQLMIVDEATLADTKTLDRLTGIAAGVGAKVLLVGDPRVAGPRVEVVVGNGRNARHVDLGYGAVNVGDTRPGGSDLTLEEIDHIGHRRMVGGHDPLLRDGVGHTPEHGDRLWDAEGEIESSDRAPHPGRGLLCLDPGRLGRAVLLRHLGVERGDALRDPVREPFVRRVRPAELFSRDGVAAHADEQGELLLSHLHARSDLAGTEGSDAASEPAAWRRTDLGVVAGQGRRHRALAITGRDAAQQVLVAAARGHPAHRDCHGRFRPTALRCASFSTTPSICTPCEDKKGLG